MSSLHRVNLILLFLVLAGFCVFGYARVYGDLRFYKLVPIPTPLTELAFAYPSQLPVHAQAGTAHFSFTIHNLEGKTLDYQYVVMRTDATGATSTIDAGSITVVDKDTVVIPENFEESTHASGSLITVSLPGVGEYIDFHIR